MRECNGTVWTGLYDENWKGLIVPEAFAHPAKFSRGLIARIYAHLLERGWLKPGAVVLDPFGGVALGALDAMHAGLHWIGCELEPKFVELGRQNLDLWQKRWGHVPGWGTATLLQGDSRRLGEVVREVGLVVSSPPYTDGLVGMSPRNVERAKAHEASGKSRRRQNNSRKAIEKQMARVQADYGHTPGQLGAMPPGSVDAVVASDCLVSSPPWEDQLVNHDTEEKYAELKAKVIRDGNGHGGSFNAGKNYSDSPDNLGNTTGDTFWTASQAIVLQCHALLRPGAVAVWVTKDFVRNKAIVPFSDQWRRLCESCGFETIEWVRASLVKTTKQRSLFGGDDTKTTKKCSFFRRLHERRSPHLAIDFEDVLIMRRN